MKDQIRTILGIPLLTITAWLLCASSGIAQQFAPDPHEVSVPQLLARFQQEKATPPLYQSETAGVISSMISGQDEEFPRARVDSLLNGLESIVRSNVASETRQDAVLLLGEAADQTQTKPRREVAALLVRLYGDVGDELVRRSIISSLASAGDRGRALAFLRRLVEKSADEQLFSNESWVALRYLMGTGPEGEQVLRDVHQRKTARNPVMAATIARYVEHNFRLPPPR